MIQAATQARPGSSANPHGQPGSLPGLVWLFCLPCGGLAAANPCEPPTHSEPDPPLQVRLACPALGSPAVFPPNAAVVCCRGRKGCAGGCMTPRCIRRLPGTFTPRTAQSLAWAASQEQPFPPVQQHATRSDNASPSPIPKPSQLCLCSDGHRLLRKNVQRVVQSTQPHGLRRAQGRGRGNQSAPPAPGLGPPSSKTWTQESRSQPGPNFGPARSEQLLDIEKQSKSGRRTVTSLYRACQPGRDTRQTIGNKKRGKVMTERSKRGREKT